MSSPTRRSKYVEYLEELCFRPQHEVIVARGRAVDVWWDQEAKAYVAFIRGDYTQAVKREDIPKAVEATIQAREKWAADHQKTPGN